MFLAVDIGGTKTLLGSFTKEGRLTQEIRFNTANDYSQFLQDFESNFKLLQEHNYQIGAVAIPGRVDREDGRGIRFGNLDWTNVPIEASISDIIKAPVVVENDAKAGGLYEALLIIDDFKKVLYVTIGTGIGIAYINEGIIQSTFGDSGGNRLLLEHNGKFASWESIASGRAITKKFGKPAAEIYDEHSWKTIARYLSLGILELIALFDIDAIVFGGGVGSHFDRFSHFLEEDLKKYQTPIMPVPKLLKAHKPEEAVVYGCYELARQRFTTRHKVPNHG